MIKKRSIWIRSSIVIVASFLLFAQSCKKSKIDSPWSKPIITTNVSGCREIVMNGDYGIITNNTPEDISNKMALLMKDKNVYNHFKKKSEERAMAFSDEKFLNSFYNLLK